MKTSQFPGSCKALIPDNGGGHIITPEKVTKKNIPPNYGAFFTVNGFSGARKKENLVWIHGIFADLDDKDGSRYPRKEDLLMALDTALPSVVNRTKNGYHALWLLGESIAVTDENREELIARVEGVHRALVKEYGADNAAVDIGHLLRVPGTEHRKDPGDPFLVTTVHETDTRYTLEELEAAFPPVAKEEAAAVGEPGVLTHNAEAALTRMLEREKVRKLWNGEVDESELSESDQALCFHLAFWLAKDPEAMERAWLSSPLGQRKKTQQRADYRRRTIDKAIAQTKDVYTPVGSGGEEPDKRIGRRDELLAELDKLAEELGHTESAQEKEKIQKRVDRLQKQLIFYMHTTFAERYPHLRYERGEDRTFWDYDEDAGRYEPCSLQEVRGRVSRLFIESGMVAYTTPQQLNSCIDRFRAEYPERAAKLEDFDNNGDWFHVANGWLNVRTREFTPHTPERLSLHVSPVPYDPEASSEAYYEAVRALELGADQERVVHQFSGYLLTRDVHQEKMLALIGKPGSGKSALAQLWKYVLGDFCTTQSLTNLTEERSRFIGSSLKGRQMLWCDETKPRRAQMSTQLQQFITAKSLQVERKGIDGIVDVPNSLKVVLTANNLPGALDVGMYRRIIHIEFHKALVDEGSADRGFYERMKKEAPGILNAMLDGLADLTKMGTFTTIAGHDEKVEELKIESDPISEFLDTYFVAVPSTYECTPISTTDLFTAYKHFNPTHHYIATPQRFGAELGSQQLLPFRDTLERVSTREGKAWRGLALKEGYVWDKDDERAIIVEVGKKEF